MSDQTTVNPGYELLPDERELWRGREWAVTTHALQSLVNDQYWLHIESLRDPPTHTLIEHIAGKGCYDLEEFIATFCVATMLHGVQLKPTELQASIERARQKKRDRESYNRKKNAWLKVKGLEEQPTFLRWEQLKEIEQMHDPGEDASL